MFSDSSTKGPVTPRAMLMALGFHIALGLVIWSSGCLSKPPETIIPIDLTVVPPWAQQTDDPDPDPNPPPPPPKKVDPPKPKPDPKPREQKIDTKVPAVEQVKATEKKKSREKPNLRDQAKLVNDPVKPPPKPDLRAEATKVVPKVVTPPTPLRPGKGTAADKPMTPEEFMRKMMEGYRVGPRNQIADNEVTRCISLITAAIRRECEKDSFKYHSGMVPVQLELSFGPGGRITGYRITASSGDGGMDQLVLRAVGRLGSIAGLSAPFLRQFPRLGVMIEPLQR